MGNGKKRNLCILFGGRSPEHDVSLLSSYSVISAVDREKYNLILLGITKDGKWLLFDGDIEKIKAGTWLADASVCPAAIDINYGAKAILKLDGSGEKIPVDVVFPVLHGANGEDGTVQGLLEIAGIPYVGCGVGASADSMDKTVTKMIIEKAGVPQAKSVFVRRSDFRRDFAGIKAQIEAEIGYPVFIKPAGTGSSVGISKVKSADQLKVALEEAFAHDTKVLAEEFIKGEEIETAVLGNDDPVVSGCGKIESLKEFYDYEAKYTDGFSVCTIPAPIPAEVEEAIRADAKKIFIALACRGLSRVDFFVRRTVDGGYEHIFNEINTLPGFTPFSMYTKLFMYKGYTYAGVVDRLIELALEEK